jgi:hypothetical protein
MIQSASYQAQVALSHFLRPEVLHTIWTQVLLNVQRPGYRDFRDPQLFFSVKGVKLKFKGEREATSLLHVLDFQSNLEQTLDMVHVATNRLYIDVGKEIAPPTSGLAQYETGNPQVYLWRRCCLESYLVWLCDGHPPKSRQTMYQHNMLRDACSLTSVTPKSSTLHHGGLIYSQFYGSIKETFDATTCFPFHNEAIEDLALDPSVREAARRIVKGNWRERTVIERAYCASKLRTHYALTDSRTKSFGIREEHRITWELFGAIIHRLRRLDHSNSSPMTGSPGYAWTIRTSVFFDFVRWNVNKFAAGFEISRARAKSGFVEWEQTKIMTAFLRCLRAAVAGQDLRRDSSLWWDRRERLKGGLGQIEVVYGLGGTLGKGSDPTKDGLVPKIDGSAPNLLGTGPRL